MVSYCSGGSNANLSLKHTNQNINLVSINAPDALSRILAFMSHTDKSITSISETSLSETSNTLSASDTSNTSAAVEKSSLQTALKTPLSSFVQSFFA